VVDIVTDVAYEMGPDKLHWSLMVTVEGC